MRDSLEFNRGTLQSLPEKIQKLLNRAAMQKIVEFIDLSDEAEGKLSGLVLVKLQSGQVVETLRPIMPRDFITEREVLKRKIQKKEKQVKQASAMVKKYEDKKLYSRAENSQHVFTLQENDFASLKHELTRLDEIERQYFDDEKAGLKAKIQLLESELKNLKAQLKEKPDTRK